MARTSPPLALATTRLELRAVTAETSKIPRDGLGAALGWRVPAEWPPELFDADAERWVAMELDREPALAGWLSWRVGLREPEGVVLVGVVGLKGPPGPGGVVEVGYSVLAPWRRRGVATEATSALMRWALDDPRVRRVAAETFPAIPDSIRVMEKCGMTYSGPGSEQGTVRYELERASSRVDG